MPHSVVGPRFGSARLVLRERDGCGANVTTPLTARPWAEALRAAGKDVTVHEFPNVDHAFHNDTSAARYNQEAATAAWAETLAFFRRHLA